MRGLADMIRTAVLVMTLAAPVQAQVFETRCGWLDNPSPANWWLTDADGSWTLSVQGQGAPPASFDFEWQGARSWVETNGSYGFGCACMDVAVNHETRWIEAAQSVRWLPLSRCDADPALPPR